MNLYFIVEGRRTEKKVYPAWLNYLIPNLKRVDWPFDAKTNNYYLFNGNGFPALLHNHLKNSIEEINELKRFSYLILVLDVDETSVDERIDEVQTFVKEQNLILEDCELKIIPQNRCIETWFLGNTKIFKANPQSTELSTFNNFYNVKENDPELMGKPEDYNTHSQFHADYCREFLLERNIRYSKTRPNGVLEKSYLNQLILRTQKTEHIKSFENFIEFCDLINSKI